MARCQKCEQNEARFCDECAHSGRPNPQAIEHAAEVLEAVHEALYGDGISGTLTSQSVELGTRQRYWRLCRDAARDLRKLLDA